MHTVHLTMASRGRGTLFPDEQQRRRAIHNLARVANGHLALFCAVDDHVHVVLFGERERVSRLARAIMLSLRALASAPLDPAHCRDVVERRHLESLVRYLLIQPSKHDIGVHPALWTGSCFPDLIGARFVPGLKLCIKDLLPRLHERAVYEAAGLSSSGLPSSRSDFSRVIGVARIAAAAAAAFAAAPGLQRNDTASVRARRATLHLARAGGVPASEVRAVLGLTRQASLRLLRQTVEEQLLSVVRRRLALEEAVAMESTLASEPQAVAL